LTLLPTLWHIKESSNHRSRGQAKWLLSTLLKTKSALIDDMILSCVQQIGGGHVDTIKEWLEPVCYIYQEREGEEMVEMLLELIGM
jgi:hypothetical protein